MNVEPGAGGQVVDRGTVETFVVREARLADEHDYDGWEALWTDDGVYWVPAEDASDPMTTMSIVHDNRHRLATRIRQLKTGRRLAQSPPSRLVRTVSNVEVLGPVGGDGDDRADLVVAANFVLVEARERGKEVWAGRTTYHLRSTAEGLRMSRKTVDLVDRPWVVPTMAFLL